jgi:hypothetical protein
MSTRIAHWVAKVLSGVEGTEQSKMETEPTYDDKAYLPYFPSDTVPYEPFVEFMSVIF